MNLSWVTNRVCVDSLGMMTAYALARIFSKLFGEVDFAAIDTDRNKYPIGLFIICIDDLI